MKSLTFKAKMDELGIASSYSRPRVNDDNPYVESLFRTVKYMPNWTAKGFETNSSQSWIEAFVRWYITELEALLAAKQLPPERWASDISNCKTVGDVHLNPEREAA